MPKDEPKVFVLADRYVQKGQVGKTRHARATAHQQCVLADCAKSCPMSERGADVASGRENERGDKRA